MSHSEQNLDRQIKRHRGPLYGITAVAVFVAVLIVWWLAREVDEAPGSQASPAPTETTAPDQTEGTMPILDGENVPVQTVPVPAESDAAGQADNPVAE
ncbi:hypothetical protein [Yoonia sp.]|uniref:hypothetical protein n=1 Tax=Yoonia sp. TaxID=2212373 RepID=UPI00391BC07A